MWLISHLRWFEIRFALITVIIIIITTTTTSTGIAASAAVGLLVHIRTIREGRRSCLQALEKGFGVRDRGACCISRVDDEYEMRKRKPSSAHIARPTTRLNLICPQAEKWVQPGERSSGIFASSFAKLDQSFYPSTCVSFTRAAFSGLIQICGFLRSVITELLFESFEIWELQGVDFQLHWR